MQEAVLILGASALQVPLINFVKQKGYYVIVVSIPGKYPGFALADYVIYLDVRDANGIYEAVKHYNIISVLTDETDIAVPTVALIAQKMGLPGNTPEIASIYSNKFLMRETCKKLNISIPKYIHITDIDDISQHSGEIQFPAIMKPEDNQGSRGIFKVFSAEDIYNHFSESKYFSKTGNVIIEEFFEGKEVVCEGFVINGEYLNWGFADRKYFDIKDAFIPCQTLFPSRIPNVIKEKILKVETTIHKELKPTFGMVHSEYIYNERTTEFILVETALRGGGVYISSHLIPLYTGYNNYELLFSCCLGRYPSIKEISSKISPKAAGYICFTLPPGEVVSISGLKELKVIPEVKLVDLDGISIGMKTKKMGNKTMRLGPILISSEDRMTLDKIVKRVQSTLEITVRGDDGTLHGVIWE